MDPFKLLKTDHRNVEKLFEELEAARGQAKLRVFEQIKTELELHTHIEEKIFYPALEEPKETHDLTLEAYEEHDVVKKLLRQLSRARTANEEWEAQAKVLQENVEHHVEEEENELFKKAQAALNKEQIEELGEELQAEKSARQRQASKSSKKTAGKSKRATKKSGGKKSASASKSASRSTAPKTARRSGTKKSAAKKR